MMNSEIQKPEARSQNEEVRRQKSEVRREKALKALTFSLLGTWTDTGDLLNRFCLLSSVFWLLMLFLSAPVTTARQLEKWGYQSDPVRRQEPPPRARPPIAARPAPIVTSYTDAAATIIETSIATGQFRKLVSAIQFAEMVDSLKADGPFTVFAPSDEAFARLPKEKTDALFADRDKMRMFLNSHIVRGKVMAADRVKATKPVKEFPEMFTFTAEGVAALAPARTVAGNLLAIRSQAGAHTLGGAKIIRTDILCSNGIIHVIDTVALP